MNWRIPTLALLLPLAACGTSPTAQPAAPANVAQASPEPTEQVCVRELPTGMRIPVTVCRNVKTAAARTAADQEWAREAQRIPPPDTR
jgi:hypothetical protein